MTGSLFSRNRSEIVSFVTPPDRPQKRNGGSILERLSSQGFVYLMLSFLSDLGHTVDTLIPIWLLGRDYGLQFREVACNDR